MRSLRCSQAESISRRPWAQASNCSPLGLDSGVKPLRKTTMVGNWRSKARRMTSFSPGEMAGEVHQGDKDTSLWPRRFYADSYSNFSPYGFCESDFSSENQEQLYIIEQLSATEATFIINEQLDFSRVISNYKYGLKAVCEEISRTEHPTSLSVV